MTKLTTRILPLLALLALALPLAAAQQLYLGVAAGTPLSADASTVTAAFELSAQFGMEFLPSLGARVALEGNIAARTVELGSADLLYRFYLPFSPNSLYLGAGADAFFSAPPRSLQDVQGATLGAHAVVGAEVRFGRFGFFLEGLPSYLLSQSVAGESAVYVRARSGVNFRF